MGECSSKKEANRVAKKQQILSILAMGNSIVGKTTLIQAFEKKSLENIKSTVGTPFSMVERKVKQSNGEDVEVKIKVWDSPGQERFETLVLNAVKNTQGIFLVFDITEQESFDDLQKWIKKVEEAKDPKSFPFVIMANKIDLQNKGKRAVSKEQAKAFADKYNYPIFETSAVTGAGVEEAFQHLIQTVYDSNQGKSNNNIIID